MLTRDNIVIM